MKLSEVMKRHKITDDQISPKLKDLSDETPFAFVSGFYSKLVSGENQLSKYPRFYPIAYYPKLTNGDSWDTHGTYLVKYKEG